jgi:hypothetical protein
MSDDELNELRQFHAEIEEYERTHPIDPAREAAELAEWEKFQSLYPGEYVSYLDSWDGRTLTWTVLAHDADLGNLIAVAEGWPEELQDRAKTDYIFPPNTTLCLHASVGETNSRALH